MIISLDSGEKSRLKETGVLIMEVIADAGVMTALEMVEVNPILDQGNASAAFAVELVQSAFGKKIL
jgi:arginase